MPRWICLLTLLSVMGCGPATPPPPPVAVVTLDGTPTSYLAVKLLNDTNDVVTNGVTDSQGQVALIAGDGMPVPAGNYRVVVTDTGEADEEDPMAARPKPRLKSRVDISYARPATTPVKLTIEPGKASYAIEVKGK